MWLLVDHETALRCANLFERSACEHTGGVTLRVADFPEYFDGPPERRAIPIEMAAADPRAAELYESYLKPLGICSLLDAPILIDGEGGRGGLPRARRADPGVDDRGAGLRRVGGRPAGPEDEGGRAVRTAGRPADAGGPTFRLRQGRGPGAAGRRRGPRLPQPADGHGRRGRPDRRPPGGPARGRRAGPRRSARPPSGAPSSSGSCSSSDGRTGPPRGGGPRRGGREVRPRPAGRAAGPDTSSS